MLQANSRKKQITLIFIAWLVYTCSYIGRYAVNANVIAIQSYFSVSKTDVGLIGTYFFIAYGIGQFVNGILCKYYNVKYVIFGALLVASTISVIIFLDYLPFTAIKYLWFLSGASISMLWTSLIRTLSKNLDDKYISIAIVAMASTVAAGTAIAYGVSAILSVFNAFKFSFLIGAIAMTLSGLLWFFSVSSLTKKEGAIAIEKPIVDNTKEVAIKSKMPKDIRNTLIIFIFVAVIINFVKDGINTWVPDVLKVSFSLPESLSTALTIVLPILAVFGSLLGTFLHKYIKEFSLLVGILFAIASTFLLAVVLLLKSPLWYLVLIAFGICALTMSASNNVVTSMIPFHFKDRANSGSIAGILNGFCSLGSALSPALLGAMFERFNSWDLVFVAVLIIALVAMTICMTTYLVKKIKAKIV